jgi:putative DNA primase/helicase
LPERESWHDPVAGDRLLDEIVGAIRNYVVMPEDSASATALWTLASYSAECFHIFPRLFVTSPEKRCGKSTLLDVVECLTNKPLSASNIRSAALYRSIEMSRPTMILDEADTFMKDDEDLRGVVNSGHKRNGSVVRCVGDTAEPRQFSTFCPMVIAGIGRQHETIEDRAIVVTLRRKRPDEVVASFRPDRAPHLERLARMAARFAEDRRSDFVAADPSVPEGVYNRQADNWRPLFAVADAAGGRWPALARKIAANMAVVLGGDTSIRISLLSDIRDIFDAKDVTAMSSADLVDELVALEGRPWGEWRHGKPITATGLARLLAPFPITPANGRFDGIKVTKGYKRSQFEEEFARYLPPPGNRAATTLQTAENLGLEADHHPLQPQPCSGSQSPGNPQESAICSVVADEYPLPDEESEEWRL